MVRKFRRVAASGLDTVGLGGVARRTNERVKDAVAAQRARRRQRSFLRRHGAQLDADPGLLATAAARCWLVATKVARPTAAGALERNLEVTTAALDVAGVTWIRLPIDSRNRAKVAVRAEDRGAVWAALAADAGPARYLLADARGDRIRQLSTHRALPRWGPFRSARVWRHFAPITDPTGRLAFGDLAGCEIEFWDETEEGELKSSRWNELLNRVPHGRFAPHPLTHLPGIEEPDFPVDLVITWVDGADPTWLASKNAALVALGREPLADAASSARFENRDELRYCLRSIEVFADFARTIHVVTAGQRPSWLCETDRLRVVDHAEILPASALPTFNSHAIEACLHHIEGLSEHFVYLNDDFLFGRRVTPDLFFTGNGLSRFFMSTALISPFSELTVDAAARNSQELVRDRFAKRVTRKFKHAPYALRRSVLSDIDEQFSMEVKRTVDARFRSETDIPVPSSFHHYFSYLTGRAVPGELEARYLDLTGLSFDHRSRQLLRNRNYDTLCVNDGGDDGVDPDRSARIAEFLEGLQPAPSSFER